MARRQMIEHDRFTEYRIDAGERPRSIHEYYVTGAGTFPYDMLRYDACWPVGAEDAAKMDSPPGVATVRQPLRSIRMHSHTAPTIARWSSFGWSVGKHKL